MVPIRSVQSFLILRMLHLLLVQEALNVLHSVDEDCLPYQEGMDPDHLHLMEGKALGHHLLMEGTDQDHHYLMVNRVPIPGKFLHLAQLDFLRVHLFHLPRNSQADELLEL